MKYLEELAEQLRELQSLQAESADSELKALAEGEIQRLTQELRQAQPDNERNVILEIRPGTGGDESELFASELFRMYQRYAELHRLKLRVLDSNISELGGLKSLTAEITGDRVYEQLKYEGGVHRVQRVPKTEKSGRIHTSAVAVVVMPEIEAREVQIKPDDLKIDVYRAGGHGGQSVNTTDSAVRITHLPTGIVVTCQDERSQLQNKTKAMNILASRLADHYRADQSAAKGEIRRSMVGNADRSDKVRTYNFPQDRLTDHRIGQSFFKLDRIMDGELRPIIEALMSAEAAELSQSIAVDRTMHA
ncbi:MAG: peptide chain release factor 1 [Candidatus Berkelbacteria bacterium Gr01-1014_85]|uniref:Peptide chain release factor 1 n=1 Tax=Candidatus Berkelbacteria bacterium Gr01-1014_85 TaxID=2017150 RepID=A0A554JAA3_9BACT|nr:MAG: peptide chain release factor 1 [Candidatus Berkelbacteria bacterium Gr01-1014_85]